MGTNSSRYRHLLHWWFAIARVLHKLLVKSDLATSVAHLAEGGINRHVVVAVHADDGDASGNHLVTTSTPLMVRTSASNALYTSLSLVQVVNKLALVILAANNAFLGTSESRRYHLGVGASWWRRSIRQLFGLIGENIKLGELRHRIGVVGVECLMLLRVDKMRLQTDRFTIKSAILDVVVRGCLIHKVLNRSLRFVRV